jgi:hypothetical protein
MKKWILPGLFFLMSGLGVKQVKAQQNKNQRGNTFDFTGGGDNATSGNAAEVLRDLAQSGELARKPASRKARRKKKKAARRTHARRTRKKKPRKVSKHRVHKRKKVQQTAAHRRFTQMRGWLVDN